MQRDNHRRAFTIERLHLTTSFLPTAADPLRFVHLSDLHLKKWRTRHGELARAVNEEDADFVAITGDLKARGRRTWDAVGRFLSAIRARHGVYVTRGNWEADAYKRVAELRKLCAEAGAVLLNNESRLLQTAPGPVRLCGLDDAARGWPSFAEAVPPDADATFTVLLSHASLTARFIRPETGVNLVLSGHTHGGQIRIPLLWRAALPTCTGDFAMGLYRREWGHVYVSRGYGSGGWITWRFRCPPEMAAFEVRGQG